MPAPLRLAPRRAAGRLGGLGAFLTATRRSASGGASPRPRTRIGRSIRWCSAPWHSAAIKSNGAPAASSQAALRQPARATTSPPAARTAALGLQVGAIGNPDFARRDRDPGEPLAAGLLAHRETGEALGRQIEGAGHPPYPVAPPSGGPGLRHGGGVDQANQTRGWLSGALRPATSQPARPANRRTRAAG